MLNQRLDFSRTQWASCGARHGFVKNPDTPNCVIALFKGIAIDGKRYLAGHVGISRKSLFNCGF